MTRGAATRAGAAAALGCALAGCVAGTRTGEAPPPERPPYDAPPPPAQAPGAEAVLAGPEFSGTRAALAAAGWTAANATAGRTLIAPTDVAWALLPPAQGSALLRPENRPSLVRVLRYWLIPVRLDAAGLAARAAAGARLPTAAGEPIALGLANGAPVLTDARGRRAYVTGAYASAAGGAVLVVNGIIAPMAIEPGGPEPIRRPGLVPGSTDGRAAHPPG